jgi:chromosome segregation ATPase
MDIKEYLRREIEKNEELQKLLDLANASESIKAEISAHVARVAEANKAYQTAYGQRDEIIAAIDNLKAQYAKDETALAAKHATAEYDLEKAYEAKVAEYAASEAEAKSKLDAVEAKVAGYAALVADYDEKTALVASLEADIKAKIAKLSA